MPEHNLTLLLAGDVEARVDDRYEARCDDATVGAVDGSPTPSSIATPPRSPTPGLAAVNAALELRDRSANLTNDKRQLLARLAG